MIIHSFLKHSSILPSVRWYHPGFPPTYLATPCLSPLQVRPSLSSHSMLEFLIDFSTHSFPSVSKQSHPHSQLQLPPIHPNLFLWTRFQRHLKLHMSKRKLKSLPQSPVLSQCFWFQRVTLPYIQLPKPDHLSLILDTTSSLVPCSRRHLSMSQDILDCHTGKNAMASSGQRPEMLLNTLWCTRQLPTTKNYPVPNFNNAKTDKSWSWQGMEWKWSNGYKICDQI